MHSWIRHSLRILSVVGVFVVCTPSPAAAQTHPCDQTIPPNPQVAPPIAVGFCHPVKDTAGQPIALTGFVISVNGTQVFSGPLNAIGTANAQGFFYFETPKTIVIPKSASVSVTVVAQSADGSSLPSVPFTFGVLGLPPSQVVKPRVVGS